MCDYLSSATKYKLPKYQISSSQITIVETSRKRHLSRATAATLNVVDLNFFAFDEGERCLFTWFLPTGLIMSRGYRSRCQSISGFGRHLGQAHLASIPFGLAHARSLDSMCDHCLLKNHMMSLAFKTFSYTE